MSKFGNDTSCLDATYKLNTYHLPVFSLVTVDNSRQSRLMALFIVQNEETDTLIEALREIRRHNPEWNPRCMMLDKSASEIAAITTTFPTTRILLCDFHRYQAMHREFAKLLFKTPEARKMALGDIHALRTASKHTIHFSQVVRKRKEKKNILFVCEQSLVKKQLSS
jgi:hypothetical protein